MLQYIMVFDLYLLLCGGHFWCNLKPSSCNPSLWILYFIPLLLNSFTLRASPESIVCHFHIFEKNFGIKQKFTDYLEKSCCLASDRHFSFKYFPKNAFVRKFLPKLSGLFCLLWVWMGLYPFMPRVYHRKYQYDFYDIRIQLMSKL